VTVVNGVVMSLDSISAFNLSDGHVTWHIVMLDNTSVINLRGKEVPRQYIQPSGTVRVTGTIQGSTVTAQQVLVPVNKDGA
jgi:hypothetical protein